MILGSNTVFKNKLFIELCVLLSLISFRVTWAQSLVPHDASLTFSSLDQALAFSKQQLQKHNGPTLLKRLGVTKDWAHYFENQIAKKPHNLFLGIGKTTLTLNEAKILSSFKGKSIILNEIKEIDAESLKLLCNWKGNYLSLNGLTSLNVAQAQTLAQFKGDFYIEGVRQISPEVAQVFTSAHRRFLKLSFIKSLDPKTAAVIAAWQGSVINLDGLEALNKETAQVLVTWKGYQLNLMGLKNLDDATYLILTNQLKVGYLMLPLEIRKRKRKRKRDQRHSEKKEALLHK